MALKPWTRLPSTWIHDHGLKTMSWGQGGVGADHVAALMALIAVAHRAEEETGVTRATYNELCEATSLSRAKLSKGLAVLEKLQVLERRADSHRSKYRLARYDLNGGWAKLPAKGMYSRGRIAAFYDFRLRRIVELDALKLFLLFVAARGENTNTANIGYDKIQEYTGIYRSRIKTAISFLASLSLIYVEHVPSTLNNQQVSNAYRIVGVDSYQHMGTAGRARLTP